LLDLFEPLLGARAARCRIAPGPMTREVHAAQRSILGDEDELAERRSDGRVGGAHLGSSRRQALQDMKRFDGWFREMARDPPRRPLDHVRAQVWRPPQ
jgi:hypothetical protein